MSRSYGGWRRYVPVAERRRHAARLVDRLKKEGRKVTPVVITGRKMATTFWGDAWCSNLEGYSDYANRLPRGRTYARNGSVIDLQVESGRVLGLVSGSEFYNVKIEIEPLARERWDDVKGRCAGRVDSLVELLRGALSKGVMEVVTRKGEGLFPSPRDITLSCSCPDWATMCKHVAATLYGVGARLDHEPELLFALRGVDPAEMVEAAVEHPPAPDGFPRGGGLEIAELSSVFGVDIDMEDPAPTKKAPGAKPASGKASGRTGRTDGNGGGEARDRWRSVNTPRPPAAKLTSEALEWLFIHSTVFIEESVLLRNLLNDARIARGRLYFRRKTGELVARITPLSPRSLLLDARRGSAWTELERGPLATVLEALERDLDCG